MTNFTRRLSFAAALVAVVVVAAAFASQRGAGAANGTTLAVDVVSDGSNTASSIGVTDTCTRVEVGANFDIDIVIRNADTMRAWELVVDFNGNMLEVSDQQFMMVTGLSETDKTDPPNATGHHYMSVANVSVSNPPKDGDGTLVRLTLHAKAAGSSIANIQASPQPPLINPGTDQYPPDSFANARIAIGQDCSGGPPVDTPGPTPTPSPSPTPSPTPVPTASPTPTATPTVAPTATPTQSATPVPTPPPTGSPPPEGTMRGDIDCDEGLSVLDGLALLTWLSGDEYEHGACPAAGTLVGLQIFGDLDCNGGVSASDVTVALMFLAGLTPELPFGCPDPGTAF